MRDTKHSYPWRMKRASRTIFIGLAIGIVVPYTLLVLDMSINHAGQFDAVGIAFGRTAVMAFLIGVVITVAGFWRLVRASLGRRKE